MSNYIPTVGDIVLYGHDSFGKEPARWRVDAWMKEVPYKFTHTDFMLSGALSNEAPYGLHFGNDWLDELLYESQQLIRNKKNDILHARRSNTFIACRCLWYNSPY